MTRKLRIGSGSAFWGDAVDRAMDLLENGELDYMSFDFLAELTMALLQRLRSKNPNAGYVPDVIDFMRQTMPVARKNGTKLVSNGGGVNPLAAGHKIVEAARELGLMGTKVGVIEGDDIFGRIDELVARNVPLVNLDTGDTDFEAIRSRIVAANVYTDASGISEALAKGADVVVAGRVSDNALYVGPIMHELGWTYDEAYHDRVAAAITIGHIIECSGACSGGLHARFQDAQHMGRQGYPFADVFEDGSAEISKVDGTGGLVNRLSITEHLLYEINDPRRYIMPDGIADFTTLALEEVAKDRVRVTNMTGKGRPDLLKVVIGYEDGWIGEGMVFFPWPNALERARKAKETVLERFEQMNLAADEIQFDIIGANMLHGPAGPIDESIDYGEIGLRVAAKTKTKDEAEKVRRACSNLWIMGPGGTSFGTPQKPRPVVSLWPTLIPRDFITQSVTILEA